MTTIMEILYVDFLRKACTFRIVGDQLLKVLVFTAKIVRPTPQTQCLSRHKPLELSSYTLQHCIGGRCGGIWEILPCLRINFHDSSMTAIYAITLCRVYKKKYPNWKIASTSAIPQNLGYFLQPWILRSLLVYLGQK